MSFLHSALVRASDFTASTWSTMVLLALCVFIKSTALVALDAGTVSLFLETQGLAYMALDFIFVALMMVGLGYYTLLFDRRQGYGSVPICALAVFIFTVILWGLIDRVPVALDILFIFKYGAFILFNVSFWSVASRFLSLRLDSLKFTAILCIELVGFFCAGLMIAELSFAPISLLIMALFALLLLVGILKILVDLNPVPSETFVKKIGGAQDISGQQLIRTIFAVSFVYMFAKGMLDYSFYRVLLEQKNIIYYVGLLWALFGGVGLCMVVMLYRTRFLYATVLGMVVLAAGLIFTAGGVFMNSFWIVFAGLLIFMLTSYFYLGAYLRTLPRPLAIGNSVRIKQERLLVLEPLGFLAAALILFDFEQFFVRGTLIALLGLSLFFLVFLSAKLYSTILLDSFKRRQWRGGPLVIATPKILHYILDHLKSENVDETLYFLRILGLSKHPVYKKNLLRLLKHSCSGVRVYVLNRLHALDLIKSLYKTIETISVKDDSPVVRQKAISLLMQVDAQNSMDNLDFYMPFLKDKNLAPGVLLGLLKIGGNSALLAMSSLQKLAFSQKSSEVMTALQIIEQAPLAGLVGLVEPLMKHPDIQVVRQALLTAGAMRHPQLLSAVFDSLDEIDLQENALIALDLYGKRAFPPLEKMLHNAGTPAIRQKILILFLNASASGEGKQILIRAMSVDNQKLRKAVMSCLINSHIIWIHKSKKKLLHTGLKKDIERFHFCLRFIELHTQAPNHETEEALLFLRRALWEDMADTRELVLFQIHLLKPHPLLTKAIRILLSDRYDQYETALGVIQDFLPTSLYNQIRSIALFLVDTKQRMPDRVVLEEHLTKALSELIIKPPFALPIWIKSTALYCLRRLGDEGGKDAVLKALTDPNPLVLEAAIWALVRLEKDKEILHQTLLTLPTRLLVGQSLEQILES